MWGGGKKERRKKGQDRTLFPISFHSNILLFEPPERERKKEESSQKGGGRDIATFLSFRRLSSCFVCPQTKYGERKKRKERGPSMEERKARQHLLFPRLKFLQFLDNVWKREERRNIVAAGEEVEAEREDPAILCSGLTGRLCDRLF